MTNQVDNVKQASRAHFQLCKAAEDPADSVVQQFVAQALKRQALRSAGMLGLAGLGVGAGARGAAGLFGLAQRNLGAERKKKPLRHAGMIEVPMETPEEEKIAGALDQLDSAAEGVTNHAVIPLLNRLFGSKLSGPTTNAEMSRALPPHPELKPSIRGSLERFHGAQPYQSDAVRLGANKTAGVAGSLAKFISGDHATTMAGVPWAMPVGVGAATAGGIGGWKLVDYLMNKRRKSETDDELDTAKQQYMQALRDTAGPSKIASDDSLGCKLDRLYDCFIEKKATASDAAHMVAMLAGGTGAGTGLGSLGGAAYGAATAPQGHRWEGLMRSSQTAGGAGMGIDLGAILAGAAGVGMGASKNGLLRKLQHLPALAIPALGYAGYRGSKWLLPDKPSWETNTASTKTAGTAADILGQLTGMYGLYAGTGALGAGYLGYQYGKKHQDREILEKALKKQRRETAKLQPLPIYVSAKTGPRSEDAVSANETM